jgi:hypothetical protein
MERLQQGDEELLAGPMLAGFDAQRGREGGELGGEALLVDVDANADDEVADARGLGVEFGEDAAEFAAAEEQVVGLA